MSDRRLRALERVWEGSGAWRDRVALERERERSGVGPGLVGERWSCAVELVSPRGDRPGEGLVFAETAWEGVLRPGLWRLGLLLGGEAVRALWDRAVGDVVGEGRRLPAALAEAVRTRLREIGAAFEGEGSGAGGGAWRSWSVTMGLGEVPPPGVMVGNRGIWKGTAVKPSGTARLSLGWPVTWLVRVDGGVCVRGVLKVVGALEAVGEPSGEGTQAMGPVPAGVGCPALLTLERLSAEGRPPTREEVGQLREEVVVPLVADPAVGIGGLMGFTQETARRVGAALRVPRGLLGSGPGTGRGALRELMSDPDVAEGFECEPGVGE